MKVLVGIPSHRRPEGLRAALASVAAQDGVDDFEIEVFVADNDAIRREACGVCNEVAPDFRWPLKCEIVEERGISAARNAILERARNRDAEFVAMIDDDEVADQSWLSQLLAMQRQTGADVVGGPVESIFAANQTAEYADLSYFNSAPHRPGRIECLDATNNVLISCSALSLIAWPQFDPEFGLTGGEDKEFFTRVGTRGLSFGWAPAAIVKEHVPASRSRSRWVLRRAFRIGNNDIRITRLHGSTAHLLGSVSKAVVVLGAAPLCLPLLLFPKRRIWIMAKWARAAGKIAALTGVRSSDYARA